MPDIFIIYFCFPRSYGAEATFRSPRAPTRAAHLCRPFSRALCEGWRKHLCDPVRVRTREQGRLSSGFFRISSVAILTLPCEPTLLQQSEDNFRIAVYSRWRQFSTQFRTSSMRASWDRFREALIRTYHHRTNYLYVNPLFLEDKLMF